MTNAASKSRKNLRSLCVALPYSPSLTETFIRSHIERLPAGVVAVHGWRPSIGEHPVLSWPRLAFHKAWRTISRTGLEWETTEAYLKVFRQYNVEAVLAEYGETGVLVAEACRRARIPLIVHFHGYDASVKSVLEEHAKTYPAMFKVATAIVANSHAMVRKLISLGAPEEKVRRNPYGTDCNAFAGADPAKAPPLLIAVGRLTPKKAPEITLKAFAEVYRARSDVRLRMIGDGPLRNECEQLVESLKIREAVTFLGGQSHSVVQEETSRARCFVQHSIEAPSGDCEGMPVAILEAGAAGLPVISTRHAGIPDVVVEGETGFLVDEGDVAGMAKYILRMVEDPDLAAKLGQAARRRIQEHFSIERSIGGLWRIIESCIEGNQVQSIEQFGQPYTVHASE